MTPALTVIIVNYNTWGHVEVALGALAAQLTALSWDAVVVDNASCDPPPDPLSSLAGRVRIIRNVQNIGFGRACNQGVAASTAARILLLNPDCVPLGEAVRLLLAELDAHPHCAAAGPEILNPDGTSQGSARGDPDILTGLFGRSTLLTRVFPRLGWVRRNIRVPSDVPAGHTSMEVDWLSGACMLLRREAFDRVGGFDPGYFLYWEDADLGRRLRGAGFTVRYVPGSQVTHIIGESSRTAQRLAVREFHRSAYRYYCTHVATSAVNPARLVARLMLSVRCAYYLARARGSSRRSAASPEAVQGERLAS